MSDEASSPRVIPQVCVIPYRGRAERLRFCLITSLKRGHWIFPKGIIEASETLEQAAHKETWEEAGLHGELVGEPLGAYRDSKWGATLDVTVVMMRVDRIDEGWPEADQRERRWADPRRTLELLSRPELTSFAESALRRLAGKSSGRLGENS